MSNSNTKPPRSDKSKKSIKVAAFIIAAIIIFYLGANFLKGIDTFGKRTYYYAVFDEIGGLTPGSAVNVKGYTIGKVTEIFLLKDDPFQICIEMLIGEEIDVPKDSKIEVTSKDILGGTIVNLLIGNSSQMAKSKDTLASMITPAMLDGVGDLLTKVDNTLASLDTIAAAFKDAMYHNGGIENIEKVILNIETITEDFKEIVADNQIKINQLVTNLNDFGKSLKEATPQLNNIMANLDQLSDSLAKAEVVAVVSNVNKTIDELNLLFSKLNRGDGDVGQLLNNDAVYKNITAATDNLNALIKDVKENPGRYVTIRVFGGKTKEERQAAKAAKKENKNTD